MSDKDQVMAKLEQYIRDMEPEEQELARTICTEVFKEASETSAKSGVCELLTGKLNPLKDDFDAAHSRLLNRMGL